MVANTGTKYGCKHKKNCKKRNISDKTAYILILGIIKVLMDKDARSIGMPITNLSHEVRRHLAKWGTQQAPRHLSTSNHSINQ